MGRDEIIPHLFKTEYRKIVSVLCKRFGFDQIETAPGCPASSFSWANSILRALDRSAGMSIPAAGASRNTHCCEKYVEPQPRSPDHSSTGASGL